MARTDSAAAELEAVSVAFTVTSAVLCKAVAERDRIFDSYNTCRACFGLGIEIPAVIGVVVGHTAVKYISLAAGELCSKPVCIFHSCVIAVILGGAVFDKVVCRPLRNRRIRGVIA